MPKRKLNMDCAKYIKINCPNCNDDKYKSIGGFMSSSGYAVEPSCLICDNNQYLIVCYNCNDICRLSSDGKACSKCNKSLTCTHWWQTIDDKIICKYCQNKGTVQPMGKCDHTFSVYGSSSKCTKCGCKGEITIVQ